MCAFIFTLTKPFSWIKKTKLDSKDLKYQDSTRPEGGPRTQLVSARIHVRAMDADPRPRTIFLLIENLNFIRTDPRLWSPLSYTTDEFQISCEKKVVK